MTVNMKITARVIFLHMRVTAMLQTATMIEPAQIRAARALLGWKQTDLAAASGISEMSIKNVEKPGSDPRASTLRAIQEAFEQAGVVFLEPGQNRDGGAGVRLQAAKSQS